jgi:hypothetical protein
MNYKERPIITKRYVDGQTTKEFYMRQLAIGLLAVTGIALAAPAVAEDFYVGGRGVGVGVDVDSGYRRDREWDRDRDRTTGYVREYDRDSSRCRTTIIREGGEVRKIRRCRD